MARFGFNRHHKHIRQNRQTMLHAAIRNKTRLHHRYIGIRDGEERRVQAEDEITSTIFGPLDFMSVEAAHMFWSALLKSMGCGDFLPSDPPSNVRMQMWDRIRAESNGKTIEPDMVVRMSWQDGTNRILLTELKWRSRLSGKDQLDLQWNHYLKSDEERSNALHLFIAPDISEGINELMERVGNDNTQEPARLLLIPWLRVRSVLHAMGNQDMGLSRWARAADTFLEQINVYRFGGFHWLAEEPSLTARAESTVFWCRHPFHGWTGLPPLDPSAADATHGETLFFKT